MRRAVGGIIVYDITSEESFAHVLNWAEEIRNHSEKNCVIMLIGNKIDVCQKNPSSRKIDYEYAKSTAEKNNFLFFESSATTFENVSILFAELAEGKEKNSLLS